MELTQSGSTVSGSVRAAGSTVALPVTGNVNADIFKYTASGTLETGCAVTVTGELTLDSSGTRLSGPQTHTTCQGVAVGTVSATRRPQ